MIESLTQRQQQLLALAILILVLVIFFTVAVAPIWAVNRHYLESIDRLEGRLQVLQRTAATGDGLQAQHTRLKRSLAGNRHYLKSASEALAAADLQGIVKRTAGTMGMEVLSTQILPATREADFTGVGLKVRMRGTLDNLVKVFHALETGQPYLFLDNVSVRTLGRGRRSRATGQSLDVDFDLIGYLPREP